MLPPLCSVIGMMGLFPPTVTMLIIVTVGPDSFCFIRPDDISPERSMSRVQFQTVIWIFWVVLAQRFLSCWVAFKFMFLKVMFYCGCRYFCTHILQHPHIKRFFAIVLGFALFTPKYVYLWRTGGVSVSERLNGCVVPWSIYFCAIVCTQEWGGWYPFPKDTPHLWRPSCRFLPLTLTVGFKPPVDSVMHHVYQ